MTVHAVGPTVLRVRLSLADGGLSLVGVDETGRHVVSVGLLVLRESPAGTLTSGEEAPAESLFDVEWTPLPAGVASGPTDWLVLGEDRHGLGLATVAELAGIPGDQVPGAVVAQVPLDRSGGGVVGGLRWGLGVALGWVQDWLADDRFGSSRLVVMTRGAVATNDSDVLDVALAPLWGLVRSAEQENPGRFVLVDLDDTTVSAELLADILATGEPEVAVRDAQLLGRRLVRAPVPPDLVTHPGSGDWRLGLSTPDVGEFGGGAGA